MNKEKQVRQRIANTYNKSEDEFPSLRAYNDYLEEVEDIIFNLKEGVDVQQTEARIRAYQEENADQIVAARARKAERIAAALREERGGPRAVMAPSLDQQAPQQSAGIQLGVAEAGQYAPSVVAGSVFMQPRPMGPLPQPPSMSHAGEGVEDPVARRLRELSGARAGGWTPALVQRRNWEEAVNSLWVK